MTITELEPAPSGVGPGRGRQKYAGTDDRCTWLIWGQGGPAYRCPEVATDMVKGKIYCSPHADKAAGI